jgi:hypothetical protein
LSSLPQQTARLRAAVKRPPAQRFRYLGLAGDAVFLSCLRDTVRAYDERFHMSPTEVVGSVVTIAAP